MKNKIWNYSVEDIVNGYSEDKDGYRCVFCDSQFTKGHIYNVNENLFDAYGAAVEHVKTTHGNTVDWLLQQEINLSGISDIQRYILQLISDGKSDKEISLIVGIADSTVRNHRFKLREKEKQAKLFLALMESLEWKTNKNIASSDKGMIEETHATATMLDERYEITMNERIKTIKTYMDANGALKQFPAKEKKKIILLGEIIKNFKSNISYTEKEINKVLERIYEVDYPTIRRSLIEYGFMDRSDDCSIYRVKE